MFKHLSRAAGSGVVLIPALIMLALLLVPTHSLAAPNAAPSMPVAVPGYAISVFAGGGTANSHPDALIYANQHLYVAYQNVTAKDGTDHKSSTVLAYNASGKVDGSWSVLGHCDGLRMDPATGLLWASSNEDGNPGLVTINTATNVVTSYQLPATPHGGGYDDMAFVDGKAFIAASAPNLDKNGVNTFPAIDQITLQNGQAQLTPVLMGNAPAVDMTSNATAPLNEVDPDSLTVDNQGNLVLVNQGGNEIVFIGHPGTAQQTVSRIPVGTQLDDTIWTKGGPGRLFITDGKNNMVYTLHTSQPDGTVFTAVPGDSGVAGFIGTVNISAGNVTPIAVGFGSPTGLLYVPDSQPTTGSADGSVPMLPATGAANDAGWGALLAFALALLLIGFGVRRVGATR